MSKNFIGLSEQLFVWRLSPLTLLLIPICEEYRSRTDDLSDGYRSALSPELIQQSLSKNKLLVENIGVEPMTSWVQTRRSGQLS